jgi:hypothetical protein
VKLGIKVSKAWETGDGRRETGDGRRETGDGILLWETAKRGGSLETTRPMAPEPRRPPPGDAPYHDEDGCDP